MTASSFIDALRLLIRRLTPTTACGSPSPPAFHDFVHQRRERASPSCTSRESCAQSARSDRFLRGESSGPFYVHTDYVSMGGKKFFTPLFLPYIRSTLEVHFFDFILGRATPMIPIFFFFLKNPKTRKPGFENPETRPNLTPECY